MGRYAGVSAITAGILLLVVSAIAQTPEPPLLPAPPETPAAAPAAIPESDPTPPPEVLPVPEAPPVPPADAPIPESPPAPPAESPVPETPPTPPAEPTVPETPPVPPLEPPASETPPTPPAEPPLSESPTPPVPPAEETQSPSGAQVMFGSVAPTQEKSSVVIGWLQSQDRAAEKGVFLDAAGRAAALTDYDVTGTQRLMALTIATDGVPGAVDTLSLDEGTRLVIDLYDTLNLRAGKTISLPKGSIVEHVRSSAVTYEPQFVTRVVVEFGVACDHTVEAGQNGVVIRITPRTTVQDATNALEIRTRELREELERQERQLAIAKSRFQELSKRLSYQCGAETRRLQAAMAQARRNGSWANLEEVEKNLNRLLLAHEDNLSQHAERLEVEVTQVAHRVGVQHSQANQVLAAFQGRVTDKPTAVEAMSNVGLSAEASRRRDFDRLAAVERSFWMAEKAFLEQMTALPESVAIPAVTQEGKQYALESLRSELAQLQDSAQNNLALHGNLPVAQTSEVAKKLLAQLQSDLAAAWDEAQGQAKDLAQDLAVIGERPAPIAQPAPVTPPAEEPESTTDPTAVEQEHAPQPAPAPVREEASEGTRLQLAAMAQELDILSKFVAAMTPQPHVASDEPSIEPEGMEEIETEEPPTVAAPPATGTTEEPGPGPETGPAPEPAPEVSAASQTEQDEAPLSPAQETDPTPAQESEAGPAVSPPPAQEPAEVTPPEETAPEQPAEPETQPAPPAEPATQQTPEQTQPAPAEPPAGETVEEPLPPPAQEPAQVIPSEEPAPEQPAEPETQSAPPAEPATQQPPEQTLPTPEEPPAGETVEEPLPPPAQEPAQVIPPEEPAPEQPAEPETQPAPPTEPSTQQPPEQPQPTPEEPVRPVDPARPLLDPESGMLLLSPSEFSFSSGSTKKTKERE